MQVGQFLPDDLAQKLCAIGVCTDVDLDKLSWDRAEKELGEAIAFDLRLNLVGFSISAIPYERENAPTPDSLKPMVGGEYRNKSKGRIFKVICFAGDDKTGDINVVFRGTSGGRAWVMPLERFKADFEDVTGGWEFF